MFVYLDMSKQTRLKQFMYQNKKAEKESELDLNLLSTPKVKISSNMNILNAWVIG